MPSLRFLMVCFAPLSLMSGLYLSKQGRQERGCMKQKRMTRLLRPCGQDMSAEGRSNEGETVRLCQGLEEERKSEPEYSISMSRSRRSQVPVGGTGHGSVCRRSSLALRKRAGGDVERGRFQLCGKELLFLSLQVAVLQRGLGNQVLLSPAQHP